MHFWTSSQPSHVLLRTFLSVMTWISVREVGDRILFSHLDAEKRVDFSGKLVVLLHSSFQAVCIIYVLFCDEMMSKIFGQMWSLSLDIDLANTSFPAVSFLATTASGEFIAQLLYVRVWFKKPMDVLLVVHHAVAGCIWPISVIAARSQFFVANMLFYELSSPFLAGLTFFRQSPRMHAFMGTMFTGSFVLVRLCTIPITIYALASTFDTWMAPPPRGADWFGPNLQLLEKMTVPLPMFINAVWGRLVINGYLAALDKYRNKTL